MSNVLSYLLLAAIGLAAVGCIVYGVVRRLTADSARKSRTVQAVFLGQRSAVGQTEIVDRQRVAAGNTRVASERFSLAFLNEETGEELRFSVPRPPEHLWNREQRGRLTYSGQRFISFEPGA